MTKREPFFTGYKPQFHFRSEENKTELTKGVLVKRLLEIAAQSITPKNDIPASDKEDAK
ncbi:hypothetical protein [Paenibacillus sp. IHBB 3054]|uniref:hypothetical protein n=1 Tax=Paenibacillus sp. IHBB 3054 TaxID=3425689 RepID=UPI003F66869B